MRTLTLAALALLAGAAVAHGAISLGPVTLDGATSTSTPPGGVLEVRATATLSSGTAWRSLSVAFAGEPPACSTLGGRSLRGTGGQTTTVKVTAPGRPGTYGMRTIAFDGDNCSGVQSRVDLAAALRVTVPRSNPNLAARCGIDVIMVLDESGSVGSNADDVRRAARAFIDALAGTGSSMAIVDFSSTARVAVPYTVLTTGAANGAFATYLRDGYRPGGSTNWEAAFSRVRELNAQKLADLVVFVTDGDPTARDRPGRSAETGLSPGAAAALRPAVTQADQVKAQGSHVLVMGVGAEANPESASRLTALSGFDRLPPTDFGKADYTLVSDFSDLAANLRRIAGELCHSSVSITKLVDEGDGKGFVPVTGWTFTANVNVPGGYTWLTPGAGAAGQRQAKTDDTGTVTFQWKPNDAGAISTVSAGEVAFDGYQYVNHECFKGEARAEPTSGEIRPNEYIRCTVRNRRIVAPPLPNAPNQVPPQLPAIPPDVPTATPPLTPPLYQVPTPVPIPNQAPLLVPPLQAPQPFPVAVPPLIPPRVLAPNPTPVQVPGQVPTPTPTATPLRVPQVIPTPTPIATPGLVPNPTPVATPRLAPPLRPVPEGDVLVFPFGQPPNPVSPPHAVPYPNTPEVKAPPARSQLRLTARASRSVCVGRTASFELAVRNVGTATARNVVLTAVVPAAVRTENLVANRRAARVRGGTAAWVFTSVPPGARRVVSGSVRVTSATPGLKTTHVTASTSHSNLAATAVNVRALRCALSIPVTG